MKAKIILDSDVPEWQIGAPVTVFFPDTMQKTGVCEADEIVRCKDCKYGEKPPTFRYYPNLTWCIKYKLSHDDDWFCADGERKDDG